MLTRILKRLAINARCLALLLRHLLNWSAPDRESRPNVFFEVSDPRLERNFYWLLKIFDLAGWNVSLKFSPWLLLNLRNNADWIYEIRSLAIRLRRPKAELTISDRKNQPRTILLDVDYFLANKPKGSACLPFSMHPSIYHRGLDKRITEFCESPRHIRIFAGGNLSDAYDSPEMEERFDIANRTQVVRTARERVGLLPGSEQINSVGAIQEILQAQRRVGLLILNRNVLELADWLKTLASSDFFIAPPGIIMPFSHNVIEAMAVGAIPITQYGHYFDPPLEEGKQCIHFNDLDDLARRIDEVMGFDSEVVERLRVNVKEYYDIHLAPPGAVKKLYDTRDELERLYIVAGHLSVARLDERRSASKIDQ